MYDTTESEFYLTPEAREQQLIALAMEQAEKKLKDGTASNNLIIHFLRLGSEKAELEKEKLRHETALLETKKKDIELQSEMSLKFQEAIDAFKRYSPSTDTDEE